MSRALPIPIPIPSPGGGCLLLKRDLGVELLPLLADPVFDCFSDHVLDPHFSSQLSPWAPKVSKKDPKWHPKATPKPPKWAWLELSKTMAVIDPMRFWPSLGVSEFEFLSACSPGAYFLKFLLPFVDFGVKMSPPFGSQGGGR